MKKIIYLTIFISSTFIVTCNSQNNNSIDTKKTPKNGIEFGFGNINYNIYDKDYNPTFQGYSCPSAIFSYYRLLPINEDSLNYTYLKVSYLPSQRVFDYILNNNYYKINQYYRNFSIEIYDKFFFSKYIAFYFNVGPNFIFQSSQKTFIGNNSNIINDNVKFGDYIKFGVNGAFGLSFQPFIKSKFFINIGYNTQLALLNIKKNNNIIDNNFGGGGMYISLNRLF